MVTDAIFLCICIIGMTGAEEVTHVFIILAPLIIITHQETYWTSCGTTFKDTAEDFHTVALLTGCGEWALPRTAPVQFSLNEININRNPCWHSIYYTSYGSSMTLAERCQPKDIAKCIHLCSSSQPLLLLSTQNASITPDRNRRNSLGNLNHSHPRHNHSNSRNLHIRLLRREA